jgi:ribonuclease R
MSKKRKKTKTGKTGDIQQKLKDKITSLLNRNINAAYSSTQITRKLGFKRKDYNRAIPEVLSALEKEGKIAKVGGGNYKSVKEPEYLIGRVDHVNQRFAYIIPQEETEDQDVYVKTQDLKNAMDGDIVRVATSPTRHGLRPEGRVLEILERGKTTLVGRIEISPRYAFVIADNRKVHQDIFIKLEDTLQAKHNDKVIIEITQWPSADKSPEGKVTRVLGRAGDNDAEIHSIMAEFDLPFEFPENVVKDAEKIEDDFSDKEVSKRKDYRNVLTFTIDPEDAKDFDDALSFQVLENGDYEVGIHIADVTHYVKPGSVLEKEAFNRATSVYLVDRTIPMLPERLSNELCSLRPREDKMTFAAIFHLDSQGKIKNEWFGRTVIHSDRRFSYEEAQASIESGIGDLASELTILNNIAKNLRKERFKKGAVNFETTEVKFKLDENGKPLGIIPKVRKDAHKLIEEFMLLANKQVATFVYKMKKGKDRNTFVYRTHDFPNAEKVSAFATFAKKFGHSLNVDEAAISSSLNKLMAEIEGKPEENVLQQLAIRSMAKAKYTTEEMGHFGLAFEHYTHFTSPIRRYPDMMVHRLLQHYLDQGKSVEEEEYEKKCVHSSEQEKKAADAERASIKYKQVEYMQTVEDKVFAGIISGVTEWGIFIEIVETKCEGMVRMVDLKDDYYEFDEKNYRVIGRSNKKMFTLGDEVFVRVKSTDIDRRTIDLEFATKEESLI